MENFHFQNLMQNHQLQQCLLKNNGDFDIDIKQKRFINANKFSIEVIPLIINDDLDGFIELASRPEFNPDEEYQILRGRFCLLGYLYQPFFDKLTKPSILCVASFFKAEKIVDFLISLPYIDKEDSFHYACAGGSLKIVRMLFDNETLDLVNKDELRPITLAAYFDNLDIVKFLYCHGCKIVDKGDSYSSINKAAFMGNISVLNFFKTEEPSLFKKLGGYKHPLISAAIGGHVECVRQLINFGGVSKIVIETALKEACSQGSLNCVKFLVNKYLNYKSRDNIYQDANLPVKKKGTLPIEAYINSVQHFHFDVLQYLFNISKPKEMGKLLVAALNAKSPIDSKPKKDFLALPFKMAKFILSNSESNIIDDTFFTEAKNSDSVKNALWFFYQINLKIEEKTITDAQIDFFRRAVLNATPSMTHILSKLLYHSKIHLFLDANFYEMKNNTKRQEEKTQREIQGELTLNKIFNSYLHQINSVSNKWEGISLSYFHLLIETYFPIFMTYDRVNDLSKNMKICFYQGFITIKRFDIAQYFYEPSDFTYLCILLRTIDRAFNNNKMNIFICSRFRDDKGPLNYLKKFNKNMKKEEVEKYFNFFDYECKDQEELDYYQKLMSIIKDFLKRNYRLFDGYIYVMIAIILCRNGVSKEWIIEQMKDDNDNSLSINPLINLIQCDIKIDNDKSHLIENRLEVIKYYLINGIDVSSGTSYAGKIWKYVIDHEQGQIADILIKYGKADKELLLTRDELDNKFQLDSISLFDYALLKKAVCIVSVFLINGFYPFGSLVNYDPNFLVVKLNEETYKRDKNLKIIALIYKFKDGFYDTILQNRLMGELRKNLNM